jgi:hypothetical protein
MEKSNTKENKANNTFDTASREEGIWGLERNF